MGNGIGRVHPASHTSPPSAAGDPAPRARRNAVIGSSVSPDGTPQTVKQLPADAPLGVTVHVAGIAADVVHASGTPNAAGGSTPVSEPTGDSTPIESLRLVAGSADRGNASVPMGAAARVITASTVTPDRAAHRPVAGGADSPNLWQRFRNWLKGFPSPAQTDAVRAATTLDEALAARTTSDKLRDFFVGIFGGTTSEERFRSLYYASYIANPEGRQVPGDANAVKALASSLNAFDPPKVSVFRNGNTWSYEVTAEGQTYKSVQLPIRGTEAELKALWAHPSFTESAELLVQQTADALKARDQADIVTRAALEELAGSLKGKPIWEQYGAIADFVIERTEAGACFSSPVGLEFNPERSAYGLIVDGKPIHALPVPDSDAGRNMHLAATKASFAINSKAHLKFHHDKLVDSPVNREDYGLFNVECMIKDKGHIGTNTEMVSHWDKYQGKGFYGKAFADMTKPEKEEVYKILYSDEFFSSSNVRSVREIVYPPEDEPAFNPYFDVEFSDGRDTQTIRFSGRPASVELRGERLRSLLTGNDPIMFDNLYSLSEHGYKTPSNWRLISALNQAKETAETAVTQLVESGMTRDEARRAVLAAADDSAVSVTIGNTVIDTSLGAIFGDSLVKVEQG